LEQEALHGAGERRAGKVARAQRRGAARKLDVGQEGGERVLAERRTGQGIGKRCAQRRGRRQGPLARALGGRGGQVARGAVIAVQRAGGDQRVQARVECFGRGQGSVG